MSSAYNARKKAIKRGETPKGKKSVRMREGYAEIRKMIARGRMGQK